MMEQLVGEGEPELWSTVFKANETTYMKLYKGLPIIG